MYLILIERYLRRWKMLCQVTSSSIHYTYDRWTHPLVQPSYFNKVQGVSWFLRHGTNRWTSRIDRSLFTGTPDQSVDVHTPVAYWLNRPLSWQKVCSASQPRLPQHLRITTDRHGDGVDRSRRPWLVDDVPRQWTAILYAAAASCSWFQAQSMCS